jgi:hypothetical protein
MPRDRVRTDTETHCSTDSTFDAPKPPRWVPGVRKASASKKMDSAILRDEHPSCGLRSCPNGVVITPGKVTAVSGRGSWEWR